MTYDAIVRSTGNAIVVAMILAAGTTRSAWAAADDCARLDAAAAATVLGVPKTRPNPVQGRHGKLSPDNMDVFSCGYAEASPDPLAPTLGYIIYTPIPKDLASVFASVSQPNIQGKPQAFSPGIGTGSTGWVRLSANGQTFDGQIVFRGAATITSVKVSGMRSADAAKNALISAGKLLAKS